MPIVVFSMIGIILYFVRFLSYYPNRIAKSEPLLLLHIDIYIFLFVEICIVLAIFVNAFFKKNTNYYNIATSLVVTAIFLYIAGKYADIVYLSNSLPRISLGLGFWICIFLMYVVVVNSVKNIGFLQKILVAFLFFILFFFFLFGGVLNHIDIVREFYARQNRFYDEFLMHIYLSLASVIFAGILSFPLGIMIYKKKAVSGKIFGVLNVIQTIPSIAMFGVLIIPLSYASKHSRLLSDLGVSGIGYAPAFIALVLYAMLPIVRNVYTGLNNIPKDVRDASIGMGMNGMQLLYIVEIPLSLAELLTGFKIALVQTIGNTALAALIGAGGLGVFIFQGLGESSNSLIMLGVLPLVIIAVSSDYIMSLFIKAVSKGRAVD
jgi:osmoprotectant transport system permease protein